MKLFLSGVALPLFSFRSFIFVLFALLAATLIPAALPSPAAPEAAEAGVARLPSPIIYDCKVLHAYPHDPGAFTQGLVFDGREVDKRERCL